MTAPYNNPHVIIVGGGFAGLTAAKSLGRAAVKVTVIDRSNHHLFQPLLYQVATATLSPADIAVPIRSILRRHMNIEVLMGEVVAIDKLNKCVILKDRSICGDILILAPGAQYHYFGHSEWKDVAPGLKSISDAVQIRRRILLGFEAAELEANFQKKTACLTYVLVGAGPTGVEMAGSIAELAHRALKRDFRHLNPCSTKVILVEAGPRILATFPETLAQKAELKLRNLGVEVRTSVRVQNITEQGVVLDGQLIEAKTVIWCAGVIASPVGKWLGAEVDRNGRIKVNSDLSLPGFPDIFVLGDSATLIQDGKPLPGLAPVAMQQGRYVGALIQKRIKHPSVQFPPFYYIDKGNLSTVGRFFAILEIGKIKLSGFLAWIVWVVVHIYYLITFRNRVLVMIQWGIAYATFQRGARLLTAEDAELEESHKNTKTRAA